MRLCMFHPVGHPMERGWVGRLDDDRVVHLAAQTLQSFFTGGGSAREHAEYPLSEVRLLAPVLHPPSVRVFEDQASFSFANPAAVVGPETEVRTPGKVSERALAVAPRVAVIVGADEAIAAYTIVAEWRDDRRRPPKDRDFALGLGPVAVTPDSFDPAACVHVVRVDGRECARLPAPELDWQAALDLAADGTRLFPGDIVAGPTCGVVEDVPAGAEVDVEVEGVGVLSHRVAHGAGAGE
jgi:2-keto-4-pentenoate hydratase/2-oxohepta-3-ene-1,7-dioic acid hydratase in catechol pathway